MPVDKIHRDYELRIPESYMGKRLDQALATLFPQFSRNRLQHWLSSGNLLIDGEIVKAKTKVLGGELIFIIASDSVEDSAFEAEDVPIDIVYEDNDLIILNKTHNMVVHPGSGNWSGTLLNGILFRYPYNKNIPRAGIVHRLDKDTTGLMVVAKSLEAQTSLVRQLQSKTVRREYFALVSGQTPSQGTIDEPIGRHPRNRKKMSIIADGKDAVTHYTTIDSGKGWSALSCLIETGRTHQIRVHLTSLGYPLIGDQTYTGKSKKYVLLTKELPFERQALHAKSLTLTHPNTDKIMSWEVNIPSDLQALLEALKTADNDLP
ncbi:MAG: 23S rRNA pseudouridine(1911/1915/1917) synthase RluD [Proteobacteria bacterium]|nr:23S rRNA pseudouridine(1911/1915/1917) synthase RluD [Pseudomonadota bacterium]MDA1331979.1 23S rRNA pseudouridine(1911/1915/1917) synthase RluD [Pseudomonadota bacterium]